MTIGVLGGGQLGQMLGQAGKPLGHTCTFFDPNPQSCAQSEGKLLVGSFDDLDSIEEFAKQCDVLTYEFENIPVETVQHLEKSFTVHPSSAVLASTQDRLTEKTLCKDLDIDIGSCEGIDSVDALQSALAAFDHRAVLKTRRFGYDGKGQVVVQSEADTAAAVDLVEKQPCILEQFVNFNRELSQIATRSESGDIVFYPLVENEHRNGILHRSVVPIDVEEDKIEQAQNVTRTLMEHFGYVGTMTIEFFDTPGGLLLNEIAPRVHNSGHWSIEGAATSQFENHIRAITGAELGLPDCTGYSAMINIIGTHPPRDELEVIEGAHVHFYGKEERSGRKLGHVTVNDVDIDIVNNGISNLEMCVEL